MRRDTPIMVYQTKDGTVICKACNTIDHQIPHGTTIPRCMTLFTRNCCFNLDKYAFDNTTCKIIMSIDGTCKINKLSSQCLDMDCNTCSIKHDAITSYKQNNNL